MRCARHARTVNRPCPVEPGACRGLSSLPSLHGLPTWGSGLRRQACKPHAARLLPVVCVTLAHSWSESRRPLQLYCTVLYIRTIRIIIIVMTRSIVNIFDSVAMACHSMTSPHLSRLH